MSEQECNFNFWSLLIGLFYVFLGMFAFNNPISSTSIIVYFIAFLVIFKGKYWFTIVMSILSIILGFMLLYNPFASLITIAMLLGAYFIVNGIIHIIHAF